MERMYTDVSLGDLLNVKLGNAFLTRAAATKNVNTMVEKLAALTALAETLKLGDDDD